MQSIKIREKRKEVEEKTREKRKKDTKLIAGEK